MTGTHPGYVVAIDVGGTDMKGGLVPGDRADAVLRRSPTERADPVAGIRAFVAELAALGAERYGHGPHAVGLAVPGPVDTERQVARYSATLGWRDVPAAAFCDLPVPVAIGNDVQTAGLAEAGHAPETDFLFLPIGTSIAGAMIIRGEPYATTLSGQIGHIPVHPGGRPCPCGQRGCLAAYSSASAIAADYGAPAAVEVARAVAAGDPRAALVWAGAVDTLALALATYTLILDPAAIVIGGGLAESGDLLLAPLRTRLAAALTFRPPPRLRASALGMRAGLLGAAALARAMA
jgi:glucokinase